MAKLFNSLREAFEAGAFDDEPTPSTPSKPTVIHNENTGSTTVINGEHIGICGGTHYGDLTFNFDR
ncbi:hypothetical protein [Streptomyces cavernicola]|uniref:Uncharacterized protein n=1 Tax=Streptomyces cavernicola TaxID=3043613 RepID=A0ABT6SEC8_9ACTN|nr:hypothetical protein [Streptomyces sp. B-S-A6]MDI3406042.1 hypothetical protein [Streptomyces sp. B-S-A6]